MAATSSPYMLSRHWSIQRTRYSTPETSCSVCKTRTKEHAFTETVACKSNFSTRSHIHSHSKGFTGGMRTCTNTTARAGAAYRTLSWLLGNSNMAIDHLTWHTFANTASTFAIIRELLVKLGLQEKNWMMLVVLLYSRHFWHPTVCSSAFPWSAFLHSIIWCSCTLPKRGGS